MHLTAILEFMYAGEVNVAQDQLPAFLKTAEKLKIKGLAEGEQEKDEWKIWNVSSILSVSGINDVRWSTLYLIHSLFYFQLQA